MTARGDEADPTSVGAEKDPSQYRWDGQNWQPIEPAQIADREHDDADQYVAGQLSDDGRWCWDGQTWQEAPLW